MGYYVFLYFSAVDGMRNAALGDLMVVLVSLCNYMQIICPPITFAEAEHVGSECIVIALLYKATQKICM